MGGNHSNHSVYVNRSEKKASTVPRYREIDEGFCLKNIQGSEYPQAMKAVKNWLNRWECPGRRSMQYCENYVR
jgi:hypothetical protein